jgi:hypothetical protein
MLELFHLNSLVVVVKPGWLFEEEEQMPVKMMAISLNGLSSCLMLIH